jgi:electron transfer flavoprotein beta subunit
MVRRMKILVCVKQVPEPDSAILIDDGSGWIQSEAVAGYRMNRLDEFAMEAALLIKAAFSDIQVDAVSVGPGRVTEAIKRSIGMGADSGVHIRTLSEGYRGSFETAALIADYARDQLYDLILTGAMSEDNMQGMVGPMIAGRLDLPCATAVILQKIAPDGRSIYVEREIEGGHRDALELPLPAVLTVQSGMNTPRYPSLSNLLRANRQQLLTIQAGDLAEIAAPEMLVQLSNPQKTRTGLTLKGSEQEKAMQLVCILRQRALLPS